MPNQDDDSSSLPFGFVVDSDEYGRMYTNALNLVSAGKKYPDYVFSKRFKHHYFMETSVAQDAAFLATLCAATDENEVCLVSIQNEVQPHWIEEGHLGAVTMGIYDILPHWQTAMSFCRSGSNTLDNIPNRQVIFGRGKSWAAHVDMGWDLAVLGVETSIRRMMIAGMQFVHNAAWAEKYWRAQSSWMGDEFYTAIRANYPSPKPRDRPSPHFPLILSRN
jgi:hypothetical protein